jgi:hypothetical protein
VLLPIPLHTAVNVSARLLLEPLAGQDGFLTVWCPITTAYLLAAAGLIVRIHGQLGRTRFRKKSVLARSEKVRTNTASFPPVIRLFSMKRGDAGLTRPSA